MRLINFALALAIFAFAVLITQRLMTSSETDWPAKSTMTADVSKRTTNLLDRAAALVGAEPARVTYGGFDMTSDIVKTRQSPAQVADQAQSAFESKLAAWKKQRRARSNVAARLLLDDLTTGFRLDGDNWSAVGVVRIPAGFEEPGFAVRGDVSTAEPTDDSLVVYADDTLRTGHATVSVLRLLSGDAMAADGTVPPALTPLEGQIELMAMRGSPGGKSPGILVRQSSDQP
ncbi:MAG: hypothetical protein KDK89_15075, partial [Alphaproteobacteria bacterium]|nr:hypothetical protein [Alphaproteobacteria bacterium]